MNKRKVALVILLVLVIQALPYCFAISASGSEHIFGGFLVNPIDGNSYLAKMQEGWAGSWTFTLLYSAQGGDGAYLFLFYLFLGHVARVLSLPIIWVFHLARIIASVVMMVALAQFFEVIFKERRDLAWKAFLLASIGAGLGWLAAFSSGYLPGDFWIAETFPFLSSYTNPHFPLGLALILWIAVLDIQGPSVAMRSLQVFLGLLLSIIQPFGLVIAAIVLGGNVLIRWLLERRLFIASFVFTMGLGGPFLLYQFLVIQNDPVLAVWNTQNQTPAPPVWDLILALSPALLLALTGIYVSWKEKDRSALRLSFWLAASLLCIYLPFNLQRRLMTGLFVPAAGLAVVGATWLSSRAKRGWVFPTLIALSLPTNIILLLSGVAGAAKVDPVLYFTNADREAFAWIQDQTPPESVILAPEDIGLWIPAQTGRRVVYGHPFETIHAIDEKGFVEAFYSGKLEESELKPSLKKMKVSYVFVDEAHQQISPASLANIGKKAYDQNGIQIYRTGP